MSNATAVHVCSLYVYFTISMGSIDTACNGHYNTPCNNFNLWALIAYDTDGNEMRHPPRLEPFSDILD
jgi:hypothetical protein